MLAPMRYLTVALCGLMGAGIFGCSRSLQTPIVDAGGNRTFDPCVAHPSTGYDPKSRGLASCCDSGPAHCVPDDDVLPKLASELDPCPDGTSVCMPDPIIEGGGQFMPAPCTSSVGNAAGVCLSQCIPLVANNPQAALLGQDGCGTGELCIPCNNPLSGVSTGACDLIALLCTSGDGGTDGGGDGGQICPYTGPPLIDPTTLPDCAPACAGAHCLPASTVPTAQQSLLGACTAKGGAAGLCAPDPLISTGGNFVPQSCTSVAGAEGRCLSVCLPSVASQAAVLPDDVCAANEKCVPCFNPTASDPTAPTGACNLACDKPSQPPVVLTCPWTGPKVVEPTQFDACNPTCYGAHCVPSSLVPSSLQSLLSSCANGTGFCTPDTLVAGGGDAVPKTCTSIAGAEGRCLSTCLPPIAAQADVLPVDVCAQGEVCAPCFDPTAPSPQPSTGACNLACDKPASAPLEIVCPYSGPNLLDPTQFPSCESATCSGAHCLPAQFIPVAEQGLLSPCAGGGFCAPDAIIGSLDHFVPKSCSSVGGVEGRCISTCLPSVAAESSLLPTAGCEDQPGTVCAPCYDPTSADFTTPTGACSLACDAPHSSPAPLACPYPSGAPDVVDPTKFPSCESATCAGAHCLPSALVPASEQALLAPCSGGFCTPDTIIRTDNHFVPPACTSIAGAEGRCISTCLPSVAALSTVLPTAGCSAGTVCAPCYNPTAENPRAPTGACSLACDAPTQAAVILSCPWPSSNPAVIDPTTLLGCGCTGAHCLPAAAVPPADTVHFNACSGGYCAPDEIIRSGGNFKPASCTAFAGTTAEGRCLSDCLVDVQSQPSLEQSSCPSGDKCAPCYNPFNGESTGACSLSSCDAPVDSGFTFPTCCNFQNTGTVGTCVPNSQLSSSQLSSLPQDTCSSVYKCAPDVWLPGNTPVTCKTSLFKLSGSCVARCVSNNVLFGQGNCPSNAYKCVPCALAPSGTPGC